MRSSKIALLGVMIAAGSASADFLGPTPYLSFADSPFAGQTFASFYLENFEDGLLNTPGLTASGGRVVGPGAFIDSVDGDDGANDGSGSAARSWYSGNTFSQITFTFSATDLGAFPTHAGIVWTDVGVVSSGPQGFGDVTFEAFDAIGVSLGSISAASLGDGTAVSSTPEDRFFGITNPGGISAIRISMSNSVDWEVDHVQYGIVPTPGTLLLLSSAGLLARRRRR